VQRKRERVRHKKGWIRPAWGAPQDVSVYHQALSEQLGVVWCPLEHMVLPRFCHVYSTLGGTSW
jgi:hypothetical protein